MRIAITGAAGRVGTAVAELAMVRGYEVLALDRADMPPTVRVTQYERVDLRDYGAVRASIDGCDALVHLAAIPGPGGRSDDVVHNTNVVSSYNALRAASDAGIRRVAQASSINAIGGRFSRWPRYDYFPVDEAHPTYAEDPYSLSKWECEQQASAIARSDRTMSIASLRLHGVVHTKKDAEVWIDTSDAIAEKQLWGYVGYRAVARAFLAGITTDLGGHETFYVVAPDTMVETPSLELAARHYPEVPVRGDLSGRRAFFDCGKAWSLLGWRHDDR